MILNNYALLEMILAWNLENDNRFRFQFFSFLPRGVQRSVYFIFLPFFLFFFFEFDEDLLFSIDWIEFTVYPRLASGYWNCCHASPYKIF